tara:strand:- start:332 stop:883 length:552 start_codon:yes stop_codon:yes gene_type:complete
MTKARNLSLLSAVEAAATADQTKSDIEGLAIDVGTSQMPAGSVLQVSEITTIAITGVVTDGNQRTFMTKAFTPKSATSTLYVEGGLGMQVYGNGNANGLEWQVLIYKASTLLKKVVNHDNSNHINTYHRTGAVNNPRHSEVSGNTTERTYTVQCKKAQASVGRLAFSNTEYPMNYLRITEVEN